MKGFGFTARIGFLFSLSLMVSVTSLDAHGEAAKGMSVKRSASVSASAKRGIAGFGRLSAEQQKQRTEHARELLGSHYKKSVVRQGEEVRKINGAVYRWVRQSLPEQFRDLSDRTAQTVIDEAHRHALDPILILSVIQTESRFNPKAKGSVGEIGLMQIRPETAEWIAKKSGLDWKGADSLYDPVTNVRIGAAYLSYLRGTFDSHARLYLSAYNMGRGNVLNLLKKDTWPKEYAGRVMQNYIDFYTDLKQKAAGQDASERKVASVGSSRR